MILCEHCIEAIRSRGEKLFVGEAIYQDIDYDEEKEEWISDDGKTILECEWCEEVDPTLYECKR